jgi:hypothetical protein
MLKIIIPIFFHSQSLVGHKKCCCLAGYLLKDSATTASRLGTLCLTPTNVSMTIPHSITEYSNNIIQYSNR